MTSKLTLRWLPCQVPGVLGSTLGLVGPVSVNCDWARWKVWSATSISVWQHVNLSELVRPWDTLACCWDVKQPTNNNPIILYPSIQPPLCPFKHLSIYPSVHPSSTHPFSHLSVLPDICQSIHQCIHPLSIHSTISLSFQTSVNISISSSILYPSDHPTHCPFKHLSVYPSVHPLATHQSTTSLSVQTSLNLSISPCVRSSLLD